MHAKTIPKYLKIDGSHLAHFLWKRNALINHMTMLLHAHVCFQKDAVQSFIFKHLYQ